MPLQLHTLSLSATGDAVSSTGIQVQHEIGHLGFRLHKYECKRGSECHNVEAKGCGESRRNQRGLPDIRSASRHRHRLNRCSETKYEHEKTRLVGYTTDGLAPAAELRRPMLLYDPSIPPFNLDNTWWVIVCKQAPHEPLV